MRSLSSYAFIALTIAFTLYGQLIIKWQVSQVGAIPSDFGGKVAFLARLLINPWIISSFAAAFVAAMAWFAAVSRLDLSHAYPYMSLTFPSVLILSALIFGEPLTWPKVVGVALIMGGIIVHSQG